jgi:hypothetical protein
LRGESAGALEPSEDCVSVRVGSRTLTARPLALATGKHNLRGWPRAHGALAAFKIGLDPAPAAKALLSGVLQLVGYRGGYAGACVIETGAISLCWLADRAFTRETGGNWRRQLSALSAQSPHFGDLLTGGRFVADEAISVAAIPFGYMRRKVIADNVFPVGDQLAVIPSFTGDGTSLALASGIAVARAVLAGKSAGTYQRAMLAGLGAQFRWARAIHLTFTSQPMRALSVCAVNALPRLAAAVVELTRTPLQSLTMPVRPSARGY